MVDFEAAVLVVARFSESIAHPAPALGLQRPMKQFGRDFGVTSLRTYFLEAADTIQIRRYPLTRHLYVPEPYAPDHAIEIEARRQRAFRELSQTASGVPLRILVFGRLRSIVETAAGLGLRLAHLPNEFVIGVPRDKLARLCHSTAFAWLDARSLHPEFQLLALLTMQ